jgi:transposase
MNKHSEQRWVGLDVSDQSIEWVAVDEEGAVVDGGRFKTSAVAAEKWGREFSRSVMAIEAGTHSPWLSRVLGGLGHRVVVANPRAVQLISRGPRKSDRIDAENLARLARVDEQLLHPIVHRGERAQAHLDLVRARAHLVDQRTATINYIRATVKNHGQRLVSCDAGSFARKAAVGLPAELRLAWLTAAIRAYVREVRRLCKVEYPETGVLLQVQGVGELTALTFVLVVEDCGRFKTSRQVGAYVGLAPRLHESGERRPQQRISKAGDAYLRRVLIQCAHYILGPFGKPSALRTWGLKLAGEGDGARKKRALVAVARKLAVLLHHLWQTGEVYEAFPGAERTVVAA